MSPLLLASLAVSVTSSCGWWFSLSGWRHERERTRELLGDLVAFGGELAELELELEGLELERRGVTYGGHGQAPLPPARGAVPGSVPRVSSWAEIGRRLEP